MNWTVVAIGGGGIVALFAILTLRERRRHRRLAVARESWTEDRFLDALKVRGVADDTARRVWTNVSFYYFAPLTPQPGDDLIRTIKVDPEDISDDVIDYARDYAFELPKGVIACPDPLTPLSYGLWLDELRRNAS